MPAQRKAGKKPATLPRTLRVPVRTANGMRTARARGVIGCYTSDYMAVRHVARKLGYSVSADLRYERTGADGARHFKIVELAP